MEVDSSIHKEITEVITQKYSNGLNNILFMWVYLVYEGNVVYLLKKPAKMQRYRKPTKEYNINYNLFNLRSNESSRRS